MKNSIIVLIVAALLILGFTVFKKDKEMENTTEPENLAMLAGCYVSRTDNDVYTLKIQKIENNGAFSGTLEFDNFEKDSSSGTYDGFYKDGILFGGYSFTSEGMDSQMDVIFKRMGNDFVRGYGELDETGTRFEDIDDVEYDASSTLSFFSKEECAA